MTTYPSGKARRRGPQNFPEYISDQDFSGWAPSPGRLQKLLRGAEYNLLGKVPIFEGNFVQVTKKGEYVGIHNHPNIIVMGILASSPGMLLPDLMIIAREKQSTGGVKYPKSKELEITRLIPLEVVEIFVHDLEQRRLKVQIMMVQKYYLQLYAPGADENLLFDRWLRLIYLLHVATGKISAPPSFTSKESGLHTIWKSASLRTAPKKQHWLSAIMNKGLSGQLKEHLQQAGSFKEKTRSVQSDIASKQSILKSGFPGYTPYSSQELFGIPTSEGHTYADQSLYSIPKIPSRSRSASKQPVGSQVSPSRSRSPQSKKQSLSKQTSPRSSPRSRVSVGIGPSQAFIMSQAAGHSTPGSRINNTRGPSRTKSVGHPYAASGVPTPVTSSESEPAPVKLQKSQKSSALVQATATTLSTEEISEPRREKEPATKLQSRSPSPSEPLGPLSRGREEGPASQSPAAKQSRPVSRPTSAGAPSASPPPRSRISVAAGPSEAGAMAIVAGPSRPPSRETQVTSAKRGTSVAPSQLESRGQSSAPHSRTVNVGSREPRSARSIRLQASPSPSPEWAHSASQSPSRKGKGPGLQVHRTTASVAVGPSQSGWKTVAVGPSTLGSLVSSMSKKQASGTQKKSEAKTKPRGAKSKEPSRSQVSESKNKLKLALSAAKQKSSLTFLTIFSVLSSSMERMKHSKSRDDNKHVALKPSKRVTISGVIGPSGKNVLQDQGEEEENPEGSPLHMDAGTSTATVMGMETEDHSPSQAHPSMGDGAPEAKTPAAGGGISEAAECLRPGSQATAKEPAVASMTSREPSKIRRTEQHSTSHLGNRDVDKEPLAGSKASKTSAAPSRPGSKASQLKLPSPRPSKKPSPSRGAPRKTDVASPPPRSKISVGVGRSMVDTVTVAAGPSVPDNRSRTQEQGKPSGRSPQRSRTADGQRSSSQSMAVPDPPPKSRVSVGVGRSVTETKSMGVGRSVMDTFSEAAGPSRPGSNTRSRSQVNRAPKPQTEGKSVDKMRKSQKPRKAAAPRPPSKPGQRERRDPPHRSGL